MQAVLSVWYRDMNDKHIPSVDSLMLPLLKAIKDGKAHSLDDVVTSVSDALGLAVGERQAVMPRRGTTYMKYRIIWARYLLETALLVEKPGRNMVKITQRGISVLGAEPAKLSRKDLQKFPEFREFMQKSRNRRADKDVGISGRAGKLDSNTHTRGLDVAKAARDLVEWRAGEKKRLDKRLRHKLTRKFVETGSIEDVLRDNPDLPEKTVLTHTRTSLRLPPDLRELETTGRLHPNPDLSLDIALFATDRCGWRSGDDIASGDVATQMAVAISAHLASDTSLDKAELARDTSQNPKVSIAVAVWIAVATLHAECGTGKSFSGRDIMATISRQRLTDAPKPSISAYVCNLCVANVLGRRGYHRKTYRVRHNQYRLYRKGDHYHPTRKGMRVAPLPMELPAGYRHLRSWYDSEYCRSRRS